MFEWFGSSTPDPGHPDDIIVYANPESHFAAQVLAAFDSRKISHKVKRVSWDNDKRREQLPSGGISVPEITAKQGGKTTKGRENLVCVSNSENILRWADEHFFKEQPSEKFFPNEMADVLVERATTKVLAGALWHYMWVCEDGYNRSMRRIMVDRYHPSWLPSTWGNLAVEYQALMLRPHYVQFSRMALGLDEEVDIFVDETPMIEKLLLSELYFFQSLLMKQQKVTRKRQPWKKSNVSVGGSIPYMLGGSHPTAPDFAVYVQLERLVGDLGDSNMCPCLPYLKSENEKGLKLLWTWYAMMREKFPIRFNGKEPDPSFISPKGLQLYRPAKPAAVEEDFVMIAQKSKRKIDSDPTKSVGKQQSARKINRIKERRDVPPPRKRNVRNVRDALDTSGQGSVSTSFQGSIDMVKYVTKEVVNEVNATKELVCLANEQISKYAKEVVGKHKETKEKAAMKGSSSPATCTNLGRKHKETKEKEAPKGTAIPATSTTVARAPHDHPYKSYKKFRKRLAHEKSSVHGGTSTHHLRLSLSFGFAKAQDKEPLTADVIENLVSVTKNFFAVKLSNSSITKKGYLGMDVSQIMFKYTRGTDLPFHLVLDVAITVRKSIPISAAMISHVIHKVEMDMYRKRCLQTTVNQRLGSQFYNVDRVECKVQEGSVENPPVLDLPTSGISTPRFLGTSAAVGDTDSFHKDTSVVPVAPSYRNPVDCRTNSMACSSDEDAVITKHVVVELSLFFFQQRARCPTGAEVEALSGILKEFCLDGLRRSSILKGYILKLSTTPQSHRYTSVKGDVTFEITLGIDLSVEATSHISADMVVHVLSRLDADMFVDTLLSKVDKQSIFYQTEGAQIVGRVY